MDNTYMRSRVFRLIAWILAVVLTVSCLSACGRGDGSSEQEEEVSSESSRNEDGSGEKTKVSHSVAFAFDLEEAGEAPEAQKVNDGDCAEEPDVPAVDGYVFLAWLTDENSSVPYDFTQPVTEDLSLTAYWLDVNDTEDSDGDGLPDTVEKILGTDEDAWDTDRDGLFDGLEYLLLHLDPLKKDTDDNGTPDGEEDTDGDGIGNAEELSYKCNPAYYDTDSDGLNDHDEVFTWNTDPTLEDTDGDGVTDGQEVLLGTDPLTPETSFATTESGDDISEQFPVTVEVTAVTDAEGAGSLMIEQMVSTDIPALNPGSLGYLAPAYSLSTEGELEEATITFTYDPSLGEDSDDFLPTIYWYDEEGSELVEVPGQVRENGRVTATVTHFSCYGLFDKSLIDFVRELLKMPSAAEMQKDENGDGIPDIAAEWLNEGRLLFNNTYLLEGILDMYGDSDDWDDDGLKNGEEIEIGLDRAGCVKIIYRSNPVLSDTDGDDIEDYEEVVTLGTSPRLYNHRSESAYHHLCNNSEYRYANHITGFEENFGLFWDFNKQEEAKQAMMNYLYDYAPEDTLSENAEAIAALEKHEESIKILGVVSQSLGLIKNGISLYESDRTIKDLNEPGYPKIYTDGTDIKKDMFDAVNQRKDDLMLAELDMLDLPGTIKKIQEDLGSGDAYKQYESITKFIGICTDAVSLYTKELSSFSYSMSDYFSVYSKAEKAVRGKGSKIAYTSLTVACDLLEGAQELGEINMTYGKVRANFSAYLRYLDMLIYVRDHAEDDYIRNAARDLAKIILDKADEELVNQMKSAFAVSGAVTLAKTGLDVAAKYNSYAAVAKTFLDLYGKTGILELQKYNIDFKIMRAFSDGCRDKLDSLVKTEGQTFWYDNHDDTVVTDYLVQLAQTRIMGEYYIYEYCADNNTLGWIAYFDPRSNHKTPDSYIEDGKNKIKTIYDYANRLQLKLSHNLPYYNDFWDPDVQEDSLDIVLEPERALKDAAGFYVLASGVGAWETDLVLNKDGSFYGQYYDMDAGFSGTTDSGESYEGTMFELTFSGKFEIGEQLTDYSYELIITEYDYEGEDGDEYVDDSWGAKIRHVTSSAAGMEGWDTYILYSPNTPSSELINEAWELFGTDQDYLIGFGNKDDEDGEIRAYFVRTKKNLFTSWSVAYADYLTYERYRDIALKFGTDTEILSAVRDMDLDGTPELIITNGYSARTDRAAYIFTFDMGQVQYIGTGPSDAYILDDDRYPGIFGKYESNWTYYRKKKGNILTESVAEGSFDPPFTRITSDDALYQAFEDGPREYLYREEE